MMPAASPLIPAPMAGIKVTDDPVDPIVLILLTVLVFGPVVYEFFAMLRKKG